MKSFLFSLFISLFLSSCATYHTRLFKVSENTPMTIGYKIYPEICAYQGSAGGGKNLYDYHDFWVIVTLRDTVNKEEVWRLDYKSSEYISAMETFKNQVDQVYSIDTIVILFRPDNKLTILTLNKVEYGWGWEIVYHYGSITIPLEIESLSVLVPFDSLDSNDNVKKVDTLQYEMQRYESHKKSIWVG
jgi:hypothetical protein